MEVMQSLNWMDSTYLKFFELASICCQDITNQCISPATLPIYICLQLYPEYLLTIIPIPTDYHEITICLYRMSSLHDLGEIEGQFLNLGIVELSQVGEELRVAGGDEVDGHSLASEPPRSADSVDVLGSVGGQVVVDDEVDLLDVDAPAEQIGGDEDAGGAGPELLHDVDPLRHLHVARNAGHHELVLGQLVGQLLHALLAVGEHHALRNHHVLVQLDQRTELLTVLLQGNVELLDTVEGELLVLHQDLHGVLHELLSHLDDLGRHGGREEADLDVGGERLEDLSDLVDKAAAEHLIGLVEDDDLEMASLEGVSGDQVFNSSGGSNNHLDAAILECVSVLLGVSAADAAPSVDVDELTEAEDDLVDLLREFAGGGEDDGLALRGLRVDQLQYSDRKGSRLASS
jgi:hypothetical protein